MTDPKHLAQARWHESGLTDDQATTLRLQGVTGTVVKAMLKSSREQPVGLLIPYFDLAGEPTDFFRVRYLEKPPGWGGAVEKPQRYAQPANTLNEVYLPPLLDWKALADDPAVQVVVTEGELKAAAACAFGIPCMGLGGVDVWRAAKRGLPLLPIFKQVRWANRSVVIAYDSDAAHNPNVVRAQLRLAEELTALGALPAIACIPPRPDGKKQGLDDLLLAHGPDALRAAIQSAEPWTEASALWGMNGEVLYVRDPGLVVVREDGQRIPPEAFRSHAYANRHYMKQVQKGDVVTLRKEPLAPAWVAWEHRAEVGSLVYEPGKPQVYEDSYNTWPGWGVEPEEGDVKPFFDLLAYLFKGEQEAAEWFVKWCAYPIQHPGTKLYQAVVMWSVHKGTGKTLLGYILGRIYGKNYIEIKNRDLRGSFNGWAERKQFILGDEITGGDARVDADWLKGTITQENVRINAKYQPEWVARDCANYLFTSNHPDALFVEDFDRRYFVHEVTGAPMEYEAYQRIDKWYRGSGPAHLMHYLLNVDLAGWDPRARALDTAAKETMISMGRSELAAWVARLKDDPLAELAVLGRDIAQHCDLYTSAELLRAFDPDGRKKHTVVTMGRALTSAGVAHTNHRKQVKIGAQRYSLWAVRNPEKWVEASAMDLADHYEAHNLNRRKA